ncbi:helix-turn-helix transcriptional regulator [Orbus mooreae]|uniref:helix-turn-helix transcriptional regulator n=1 Tax=Orbus mooreae TaxID=3074107 RepID=UPI00370D1372
MISGSLKIIRREKNHTVYKTLTANDIFFTHSNDYTTNIYLKPVTLLSILFEKQHINCNLLYWDGQDFSLIEEVHYNYKDYHANQYIIQALSELSLRYINNEAITKTYRFLILGLLNNILLSNSVQTTVYTTKKLRITLIRQYIDIHFQETVTREQLANLFHISPNYLSFAFNQEQGIGLNEYILQTKLRHAKKLLIYNQLNIKDISTAAGFQDDSYFRRIFRKKIGCTPTEYKDRYGKK